jgi:threonine dehydrogenase-like Zn-dependent dehydrogenase
VVAVDARRLFVVPREMPDDVAVLAEPVSVAYRAVQRSAIEAGSVAVVIGAGPIGLLVTQLLVAARGCRVLVAELDPWKREVAASFGATPLPQDAEALVEAVVEATGGELADVVFEASGSAAGTRLTTAVLAQAGRIVLIGWNKGPVEVDTVALMRKEADVLGSRNSTGAFPAVLRLLEDGVIDAHAMITHRFGLDRAGEALALLDRGNEQALKILVYPRGDLYS